MPIRLNYQAAALRVCIDQVENGSFRGRIIGQRLSTPVTFVDVNDFLARVNVLLDVQKFPQAFQSIRSFTDKEAKEIPAALSEEEMSDSEEVERAQGQITTFLFQVMTRQNSSWQGYIDWLDGSPKQFFDSILEFVKFIAQKLK